MNYEKLTVERFMERLKSDEYDGIGGARRAVGKSSWSEDEKNKARTAAEKHFGTEASAKPARAKKEPKAAAKKAAKKTGGKVGRPKKVAAAAAPPKRAARSASIAAPKPAESSTRPVQHVAVVNAAQPPYFEEATRASSAAIVIQSMRGTGTLSAVEQRTYAVAHEEYWASARESARQAVDVAAHGLKIPALDTPVTEHVTAPAGGAPRIPVPPPNGIEDLTPEEQEQYRKLQRGLAAAPGILGQPTPPPNPQS